jgi:hypothetical protein
MLGRRFGRATKHSMRREEPRQMRAYRDRSDAGAATAVRNAKSLVQIQV